MFNCLTHVLTALAPGPPPLFSSFGDSSGLEICKKSQCNPAAPSTQASHTQSSTSAPATRKLTCGQTSPGYRPSFSGRETSSRGTRPCSVPSRKVRACTPPLQLVAGSPRVWAPFHLHVLPHHNYVACCACVRDSRM